MVIGWWVVAKIPKQNGGGAGGRADGYNRPINFWRDRRTAAVLLSAGKCSSVENKLAYCGSAQPCLPTAVINLREKTGSCFCDARKVMLRAARGGVYVSMCNSGMRGMRM